MNDRQSEEIETDDKLDIDEDDLDEDEDLDDEDRGVVSDDATGADVDVERDGGRVTRDDGDNDDEGELGRH